MSGSLARGDDGPGSDVDLWAIGKKFGRDERFVDGVPVTVFYSRPKQLEDLEWINRWDVERLVVLFDHEGDFVRLRTRYVRQRARLMRSLERRARAELKRSRDPRKAWLEFSLAVFLATGTRVPKWKHAVALLNEREVERFRRRLMLPKTIDRPELLALLRKAPREAARLLKEKVPRWAGAEQHVRHGSVEEAVLKVRADLDSWLGGVDVSRAPALKALREAVRA